MVVYYYDSELQYGINFKVGVNMFNSLFLDQELRTLVDTVTQENLDKVKVKLLNTMSADESFKDRRHFAAVESAHTPARLQQLYYAYILAAEGLKTTKL